MSFHNVNVYQCLPSCIHHVYYVYFHVCHSHCSPASDEESTQEPSPDPHQRRLQPWLQRPSPNAPLAANHPPTALGLGVPQWPCGPWHPNHPNLPQAFMDTGWLKWTHLSVDTGRFWSRKSGLQTIHFAQGILPSHTEKHVLFLSAQRLQTLWCNQCQPWGWGGSWRIHYSNAGNAGNAPTEEQALDVRISSPPGWFPNRGRKS